MKLWNSLGYFKILFKHLFKDPFAFKSAGWWQFQKSGLDPARLYTGQFWPRKRKINKAMLRKRAWLEVHGSSHCDQALLLGWIRAAALNTAENPALVKVLEFKTKDSFSAIPRILSGAIPQDENHYPGNENSSSSCTKCRACTLCHRMSWQTRTQGIPWRVGLMAGIFVLSQENPHRDALPWHLCPDHCKRQMRDCPRLEDSFLNSKSCSQTSCEARGQWAPHLPRPMGGVETQGENPWGMNLKNQRAWTANVQEKLSWILWINWCYFAWARLPDIHVLHAAGVCCSSKALWEHHNVQQGRKAGSWS